MRIKSETPAPKFILPTIKIFSNMKDELFSLLNARSYEKLTLQIKVIEGYMKLAKDILEYNRKRHREYNNDNNTDFIQIDFSEHTQYLILYKRKGSLLDYTYTTVNNERLALELYNDLKENNNCKIYKLVGSNR